MLYVWDFSFEDFAVVGKRMQPYMQYWAGSGYTGVRLDFGLTLKSLQLSTHEEILPTVYAPLNNF